MNLTRLAILVAGVILAATAMMPPAKAQTAPANQALYELLSRMTQLEREIRQLRGDLEIYQHRQQELTRRLQDLESRVLATSPGEGGVPPESQERTPIVIGEPVVPTPPPAAGVSPQPLPATPAPPPAGSEQEVFDAAFNSLRQGQYEQAVAGFEGFMAAYPNSVLAPDALYWLGETYYVVRDFPKARAAFIRLGSDYSNSDKLPEAMLKLGYLYDVQGDKDRARQVLEKLIQTYPNSRAARLGEAHLRSL